MIIMKLTPPEFLLRFLCCFGGLGVIGMVTAYISVNSAGQTIDFDILLQNTNTTNYFILFWACLVIGVLALLSLQALDYRSKRLRNKT